MTQRAGTETDTLSGLLAAVALGDHPAFRAFYEATAPKLFPQVLRITRNRAVAEEVLQETYVKIWLHAERFSPDAGKPQTWLAAIARNRAIDRLRSERFDRFTDTNDDDAIARIAAQPQTDPADRESIRTCLGELDDEARRCVVLAYCSGFTRDELAERFGRPVGTIKTLLHRAIKVLRACLEKE